MIAMDVAREWVAPVTRSKKTAAHVSKPPAPLTPEQWQSVVAAMKLSPQQAAIVAMVLQGKQDKEIAAALGLRRPTVRTYLGRIFSRVGVEDRLGLVIRAFTICLTSE